MVDNTASDFARYINILRSQGYGRASLEMAREKPTTGRGTSVTSLPNGSNLDSPGLYYAPYIPLTMELKFKDN